MQSKHEVIVQRFHGSQLADADALGRAARIVADALVLGQRVAVVVGPLPRTLSELSGLVDAPLEAPLREEERLVAAAAQLAAPVLATLLQALGVRAVSVPEGELVRGGRFDAGRVLALLDERLVPVIPALPVLAQGARRDGWADASAVALGAAVSARFVELYTDDLREPDGRLGERLDYDAFLALGAGTKGATEQATRLAKERAVALRLVRFAEPTRATLIKHPTIAPPAPDARAEVAATGTQGTEVFEARESNVRGYCRSFPAVFARAKGALQWDERGKRYVDFFSGAGALNYGHNPDRVKRALLSYLESDGVSHALDMYTQAKRHFLETFRDVILAPRGLDYKVQFCGPTGANSVEAALKLARLKTGRTNVASFTGGWHGMTAACLAVCGNRENRDAAGTPLPFTSVLPYPEGPYKLGDALGYVEWLFEDPNSGLDKPAALILETLQSEGGIYAASNEWLRGIRALCDRHGVLLIADDIQVGCGRTGSFFSFERAGIVPDIVCLSKSIGGYGQPMSLLLMRPEVDVWQPGQHTGTFRGNQLAFVASAAALEYWRDPAFSAGIAARGEEVKRFLSTRVVALDPAIALRGLGLMWGVDLARAGGPKLAKAVSTRCFERGLIVERCGRDDTVLKLMPPLDIPESELAEGLEILAGALEVCLAEQRRDKLGA